jgi:hypothetical protein
VCARVYLFLIVGCYLVSPSGVEVSPPPAVCRRPLVLELVDLLKVKLRPSFVVFVGFGFVVRFKVQLSPSLGLDFISLFCSKRT